MSSRGHCRFIAMVFISALVWVATPIPAFGQQLLNIREPSPDLTDFVWGTPKLRVAKLKVEQEIEGRLYVKGHFTKEKTVSVYEFDEQGAYRRKIIVATRLNPWSGARQIAAFERWRTYLTQKFGKPSAGACLAEAMVYDSVLEEKLEQGQARLTCDWSDGNTLASLRTARYGKYLRTLVVFQDPGMSRTGAIGSLVNDARTPANIFSQVEFEYTMDRWIGVFFLTFPILYLTH